MKLFLLVIKYLKAENLRKIILSEETRAWKFITKNKYLNPNRISTDVNLLNKFYKNRGYYNVKIKSSYATVENNKNFKLIFSIDAGEKFYFNDFFLNITDDYADENFTKINNVFEKLKGSLYSIKSIDEIKNEIDKIALQKEFVFIDAKFEENIIDQNKINVNFF